MANIKSAIKRARQGENRRRRNASYKAMMRTALKKVIAAVNAGDKATAESHFVNASSLLDKAANKGLIHRNKAARHKSRLTTKINALK